MSATTRFTKAAVLAMGMGASIATPRLAGQVTQGSDVGGFTVSSFGAGFTTQLSPGNGWIADYFAVTDKPIEGTDKPITPPPVPELIDDYVADLIADHLPKQLETTANPESGTMALLGAGLLVLALAGYRRSRRPRRGRSTMITEGSIE